VPTAEKVYTMLGNDALWQTATQCHQLLAAAKIPHAIMGGVAVCLHGYQRNTTNIDILLRQEDSGQALHAISSAIVSLRKFRKIRYLLVGDLAGTGSEVRFPDPGDENVTTEIEGLRVLTLAKLIESKIACGTGNMRRTRKDFADVVELIALNRLNSSFARHLHKSLRTTYKQLVKNARGNI
jgi:hypothetical protein